MNLRPIMCLVALWLMVTPLSAQKWPRFRGPQGNATTNDQLPLRWGPDENVHWKFKFNGEGSSSPIVWNDRIFLTLARDEGTERVVLCLDRHRGKLLWEKSIRDENPELASVVTGYAAATPVTDGRHIVAFFGNAGLVCYDLEGNQLWHQELGEFDSELGLASSPVIHGNLVIQVCDHDGTAFRSFDSYLVAFELTTGRQVWKTPRRGLFRSWSTPIVVSTAKGEKELIINAQDQLRGYDPRTGKFLWSVDGMTGWVTPAPVSHEGLVYACSGKDGPTMAVRPGGRGDVSDSALVWIKKRGAPYVSSPVVCQGRVYVFNELGILTCLHAPTGAIHYQHRVGGRFFSSPIVARERVYATAESGETVIIQAGQEYQELARNQLNEECVASPAVAAGDLLLRTQHHLFCIREK